MEPPFDSSSSQPDFHDPFAVEVCIFSRKRPLRAVKARVPLLRCCKQRREGSLRIVASFISTFPSQVDPDDSRRVVPAQGVSAGPADVDDLVQQLQTSLPSAWVRRGDMRATREDTCWSRSFFTLGMGTGGTKQTVRAETRGKLEDSHLTQPLHLTFQAHPLSGNGGGFSVGDSGVRVFGRSPSARFAPNDARCVRLDTMRGAGPVSSPPVSSHHLTSRVVALRPPAQAEHPLGQSVSLGDEPHGACDSPSHRVLHCLRPAREFGAVVPS